MLEILARASQGAIRVLGISAYQGNRAQFGILCGSEFEKGLGKFFARFWSVRRNLKIVGIVKLLVIAEPKEAHQHQIALDDNGHNRGDQVRSISRDDKVNIIDIEQFGVDARDRGRLGLVVVVDEFHRTSEETALFVDLVSPDLHGQ